MDLPPNSVVAETRAEWRAWLSEHHAEPTGVWLVTYKKNAPRPSLPYGEAVEEALCFGWVDSKPGKLDEARTMLYFAPRKKGSGWSRLNKERVEKLIAAGLMTPAGQAKIDAARADGSWSALDAVENLDVPPDLREALSGFPRANANFEAFPRSAKRGILEWIAGARTEATRAKRVQETARLAEQNLRANAWRK